VVAECAQPDDPFAGDAGRLLDNMLHALRLHHNPRVFIAPLVRGDGDANGGGLAAALGQTQAALVLALGLPAARTVLGRSEPLGRLRASPQAVDGTPVAVTYDPAYLLRAPQAKASAWADLCHAAALVAVR
jgi:DNA polymerase